MVKKKYIFFTWLAMCHHVVGTFDTSWFWPPDDVAFSASISRISRRGLLPVAAVPREYVGVGPKPWFSEAG